MADKPDEDGPPRCMACGAFLPKFSRPGARPSPKVRKEAKKMTGDGKDPEWGTRGDNIVCNTTCSHLLLLRLFTSVPELSNLLPPEWRFDLKPLEESPKVIKQKIAAKRAAAYQKRQRQWRKAAKARQEAYRIRHETYR